MHNLLFQDYQRISKPSRIQWPIGRSSYSSVVISSVSSDGVKRHYLLILGGWDGTNIISDCWIMNIENKKWTQVIIPQLLIILQVLLLLLVLLLRTLQISLPVTVSKRLCHSMISYMMSMNCVWLLITGGFNTASDCVSGANIAMNIELGTL